MTEGNNAYARWQIYLHSFPNINECTIIAINIECIDELN